MFKYSSLKLELAKVKMDLLLIENQEHNIICKNRFGNIIQFSFDEVWNAIYNEEAIGCGCDCQRCLTPIC